jgi:hypothetical protein
MFRSNMPPISSGEGQTPPDYTVSYKIKTNVKHHSRENLKMFTVTGFDCTLLQV